MINMEYLFVAQMTLYSAFFYFGFWLGFVHIKSYEIPTKRCETVREDQCVMVIRYCKEGCGQTMRERGSAGRSSSETCLTSRRRRGCLTEAGNLFWDPIQSLL